MSADQELLRVRDRAAVAEERVDQKALSQNGQRPNGKVRIGEHGQRAPALSNGVAPSDAATNGSRVGHPSTNGVGLGQTLITFNADWDSCLPERSARLSWKLGQRVKRVLDAVLAFGIVLALVPLFLVVALLVKLTSRGPVLYVCEYVGWRGRRFMGYKFRTMVADAEAKKPELLYLNHMKGPAFKIRRDPRITPLGRVLRKFSIDELPQLWNVVRGDMSLVGPRPPLPEEWVEFAGWHRAKLAVVPGITCTWQVKGRAEIPFQRQAIMDRAYLRQRSFVTDLKLLVMTVPAVIGGRGAY